jgi:hypothetical protein
MDNQLNDAGMGNDLLKNVREGMDVYDRDGKKVGEVDEVFLGAVDSTESDWGQGAATNAGADFQQDATIVENVIEALGMDDEIERSTIRGRLEREGFVRVRGGLFKSNRYILPEQIAAIENDRISLRGKDSDLLSG